MGFNSGRVSFCRFRVRGDAPSVVDDTALATFAEHAFRETEIGAPEEIEAGFTAGDHLFDTQFSFEKNAFGASSDLLMASLRIDTHKVPAEVKYAYKRMNELAVAKGNPSGHASKSQKREAVELAQRQVHEDLAAGKYRRSKTVPILWDLAAQTLYCGAYGNAIVEQLTSRMRDAFNVALEPITAGSLAAETLRALGKDRDFEDVRPSAFTPAPRVAGAPMEGRDAAIPLVPWVQAVSADTKDFLGNELLIWLWWVTENKEGLVDLPNATGKGSFTIAVAIDRAIDMDCAWGVTGKQSLRSNSKPGGDSDDTNSGGGGIGSDAVMVAPTRLPEAREALANGKWPRKLSLILADTADGKQWELSLQGDRWMVGSSTLPDSPETGAPREYLEGRLALTRQLASTLDGLYSVFLRQRVASNWPAQRKAIREWIEKRK